MIETKVNTFTAARFCRVALRNCTLRALFVAVAVSVVASEVAWAGTLYTGTGYQGGLSISLDGGHNFQSEGGGSIGKDSPGNYDGHQLPFMYCVEIQTTINVPGTYDATLSRDGIVHGGLIANAGQIAWLIDHIAPYALTGDEQAGLQAAIWKQVYGANFVVGPQTSAGIIGFYNHYINDLGSNTAPVSDVAWISPYYGQGQVTAAQGQVTAGGAIPVPEPSSLALMGLGGLGLLIRAIRGRRLTKLSSPHSLGQL